MLLAVAIVFEKCKFTQEYMMSTNKCALLKEMFTNELNCLLKIKTAFSMGVSTKMHLIKVQCRTITIT